MTWLLDHWLPLLGWTGSALLVGSILQTRVLRFRLLNAAATVTLATFNLLIQVWPMVAMNVVLLTINLWFLARMRRRPQQEQGFTVLAVGSGDAYLNHVLRTHDVDIHRHQPDFVWNPARNELQAYLVQKGDETVGVVVLRTRDEVAYVELDYVTPGFRDCAAGEHVWLRSDILRGRGVRRVLTPPNMKDPYYARLGFRREGRSYVLDLSPAEVTRPQRVRADDREPVAA
ncbi:hypothetical protein RDV89_12045 [Nocardioides zeae]|uniref:N-acetyltransferase domain-containing protein n=1 Tax=Nocardioides imazamoxiresistens TaxID=3231893 RepID=A0ABU3PXC0_9ACTN|nr:hypothetical protein [Nocardioides zeae]MDT9593804.1 hypothetical protein [Nocardioides zeae]